MCKDWSRLETWAVQHTACFSLQNSSLQDAGSIERFRFCPEGSPYIPQVEEAFGENIIIVG